MLTLGDFLTDRLWAVLTLWVLLYISDYLLTIAGAKLHRADPQGHFVFADGYELNPYFAEDVARLRLFSTKFLWALALYSGWLALVYAAWTRELFAVSWGALIFLELVVHIRHIRNLVLFKTAKDSNAVQGRIGYARWLALRLSGAEMIASGVVLLFVFLITGSLPVAGGALSCAALGIKHIIRSAKLRRVEVASSAQ
jgi:hypothetical protein